MMKERILLMTKNWLGDVIFEEPVIRALRRRFPDADIVCMTTPRCKEIIEANPHVSQVIVWDDRNEDRGLKAKLRWIYRLKKERFTKAILLHRSFSRAVMVWCAGIPERYGYRTKGRGWLFTKAYREPQEPIHRVDYFLSLVKHIGWYTDAPDAASYLFYTIPSDDAYIRHLMHEHAIVSQKFIILNPGANWEQKRWPVQMWRGLIEALVAKTAYTIVISGSVHDKALAEEMTRSLLEKRIVNLCGLTTIRQAGALFREARCVISADSGPLHVAGGVGTPVVALFGPTDPQVTGPRGKGLALVCAHVPERCTIPCYQEQCESKDCMYGITIDTVCQALQKCKVI